MYIDSSPVLLERNRIKRGKSLKITKLVICKTGLEHKERPSVCGGVWGREQVEVKLQRALEQSG